MQPKDYIEEKQKIDNMYQDVILLRVVYVFMFSLGFLLGALVF